ncbi:MAG: glycosyltransferase [Spirochaetia bacterium]
MGNNSAVRRILVPYFLAGSGHLVSAKAIAHYLRQKQPDWKIELLEPADHLDSKPLDRLYRRSWHTVLRRPKFSEFMFSLFDSILPSIPIAINRRVIRKELPGTRILIDKIRPDLIMTTHWGCGHLFQAARVEYDIDVPLFLVRNDLGGAFHVQDCGCDITFVMSDAAKKAFVDLGVPPEMVKKVNLLVRPEFLDSDKLRASSREKLGIRQDEFTVLLSAGGEGLGSLEDYVTATISAADYSDSPLRLLVLTGRNEELRKTLDGKLDDSRVSILGYRDDMPSIMAASDLVVGKCGANYTMETLMMGKPFVITQIGAPSERFNMEFVVDRGYGWYTPSPEMYARLLRRCLTDETLLAEVRERLTSLPRKSGAEQIAEAIIDRLE